MSKVLFIFLDGAGIGRNDSSNPFTFVKESKITKYFIDEFLPIIKKNLLVKPIDTKMGLDGLPQSATGQTALFTGINPFTVVNRHISAFPTKPLRKIIEDNSIFKSLYNLGKKTIFANAYSKNYFELVKKGKRAHSASTLSVLASEIPFNTIDDLEKGNAVFWDINHIVSKQLYKNDLPKITPEIAADNLIKISNKFDFTLYETFLPDLTGHKKRVSIKPVYLLNEILIPFLERIINKIHKKTTIVITSDHGNIENSLTKKHTKNPVPLIIKGNIEAFKKVTSIFEVAPAIIETINLHI